MRGVPINDGEIPDGFTRRVFAAPNGDLTSTEIAPLDVVYGPGHLGDMIFCSRWVLEPGDIEKITETGQVWLIVHGLQPPVSLIAGSLTE